MAQELGVAPRHCFSVDVEEHFQVTAFESPMRRRHWDQFESRVRSNTDRLLDLFGRNGMKATFFVLGWVAERSPRVVQAIAKEGHEIASHGFGHELITSQTTKQFRQDVRKTKEILEDLIGQPVLGYRAPSFSITAETVWALTILAEEGYRYDSSMFPSQHRPDGARYFTRQVHKVDTDGGPLWEVPLSTATVGGIHIPIAGGGYLRQFPYWLYAALLKRAARYGEPLVMYLHPWELDPEQPRMAGSWVSRLRHYRNLAQTEDRLVRIIDQYRFGTIRDVLFGVDSGRQLDVRYRRPSEPLVVKEVA